MWEAWNLSWVTCKGIKDFIGATKVALSSHYISVWIALVKPIFYIATFGGVTCYLSNHKDGLVFQ